ncbi:MAG: lysoplasmalogenase [Acidobacteriota bacterium]|nr:MAG: lysoplasmalogenase [Acidobacteriota bacterium]
MLQLKMMHPTAGGLATARNLVLGAIALASVGTYAAGAFLDLGILKFFVKPVPVVCLALWVFGTDGLDRYAKTIGVGLLFGALGDILLEAPDRTFLPGLIAFLLGHLVYIGAFLLRSQQFNLIRALPVYAFGSAILMPLLRSQLIQERGLEIPVIIYMIVICAMVWRAWTVDTGSDQRSIATHLALAGALLFLISDSILAVRLFLFDLPFARFIIMATYWLGQFGIAASAIRYSRPPNTRTT